MGMSAREIIAKVEPYRVGALTDIDHMLILKLHSDDELDDLIDDFIVSDDLGRHYRAACREYDRRHQLTVGVEAVPCEHFLDSQYCAHCNPDEAPATMNGGA